VPDVFEPIKVGNWELPQRFVMAPLTRNRAGDGQVPQRIAVTYYAQRAGAGLIVTEGTQPSAVGQGYLNTPGIHTAEQIAGWRAVADAVHAEGGRVVVQLMHVGRIAHPDNKNGLESVAPSAIQLDQKTITAEGEKDSVVPRALETDEIRGVVEEFVHAAKSAIEAGLDGVELHSANGYLLHQFLAPSANERTDEYGGSPKNRARFSIEVTKAVVDAIGADRVAIRVSPAHNVQGAFETDPDDVAATYGALIDAIAPLDLAYLSVLADPHTELFQDLRRRFNGPVIANTGFMSVTDLEEVQEIVDGDLADLVAVGRQFIANPDLVTRWKTGAELNEPNGATFYGGGAEGYIDYPTLEQQSA